MRFTQAEKYEIIRPVETSEIGVNRTLKEIGSTRAPSTTGTVSALKVVLTDLRPTTGHETPIGTEFPTRSGQRSWKWPWIFLKNPAMDLPAK